MKKTILKSVLVAFLATTSFSACSNDNEAMRATVNPVEKTIASKPPPPPGLAVFNYKEGGALSYSTVSNPIAIASSKKILAINGIDTVIEMKMNSLAVGTYPIGSLNKFIYNKPLTMITWTALTGTITITFNASGMLSGSFNMTSGTGIASVNSVSGTFDLIPITP